MLIEFATWYADRVTEMLPARMTRAARGPVDALIVEVRAGAAGGPGKLALTARLRGRETSLGSFDTDKEGLARAKAAADSRSWPDIALKMPRGALLERIVTLPLAAEAGLASVLEYEMDRYTPFTADEVHWSADVVSRDREQERMRVRILLAPRAALVSAREALGQLGIAPTLVESSMPDGAARQLALRAVDEAEGRSARRWLIAACAVAGLLGVAVIGLPFLRQMQAADAVEARIAALEPQVAQADALRQRLLAASAGNDVIAAEEARLGEPLQVISALTQLLPDDTYLTVLTLHDRQIEIDGQSAAAARLIGLLSSDPVIRNAAFAAPVTRADNATDMFSLKAEDRS